MPRKVNSKRTASAAKVPAEKTCKIKLPVFNTIAVASAVTGIPRADFSRMKEMGCSAFRNDGRIDLALFLPFYCEKIKDRDLIDREYQLDRQARADAERKERENKAAAGELMPKAGVQAMVRDAFLPVRQRLIALPASEAANANPSDPEFARLALERWRDDFLKQVAEELPGEQ